MQADSAASIPGITVARMNVQWALDALREAERKTVRVDTAREYLKRAHSALVNAEREARRG